MERVAGKLHVGMTESDVVILLGQPDYTAGAMRELRKHKFEAYAEFWHYVHTWERPVEPDHQGKMLVIELTNKSIPRVVVRVDKYGFD